MRSQNKRNKEKQRENKETALVSKRYERVASGCCALASCDAYFLYLAWLDTAADEAAGPPHAATRAAAGRRADPNVDAAAAARLKTSDGPPTRSDAIGCATELAAAVAAECLSWSYWPRFRFAFAAAVSQSFLAARLPAPLRDSRVCQSDCVVRSACGGRGGNERTRE